MIRVHGLIAAGNVRYRVGPIAATLAVPDARLEVTVVAEQQMPVNAVTDNWYVLPGEPATHDALAESRRALDPQGCWIRVLVSGEFQVPAGEADRFRATHDAAELHGRLAPAVDAQLRGPGLLTSGQIVAAFPDSDPNLRGIAHAYWWGASDAECVIRVDVPVAAVVVPRLEVRADALEALTVDANATLATRAGSAAGSAGGPLAVAAYWLLTAADLRRGSNERFLLLFHAMESLVRLAPDPGNDDRAQSERVRALVAAHAPGEAPELSRWLASKKGDLLRRPLRARFAALAEAFRPSSARDDLATFDACAALRNRLVHGQITEIQPLAEAHVVEERLRRLAFTYLRCLGAPPTTA